MSVLFFQGINIIVAFIPYNHSSRRWTQYNAVQDSIKLIVPVNLSHELDGCPAFYQTHTHTTSSTHKLLHATSSKNDDYVGFFLCHISICILRSFKSVCLCLCLSKWELGSGKRKHCGLVNLRQDMTPRQWQRTPHLVYIFSKAHTPLTYCIFPLS